MEMTAEQKIMSAVVQLDMFLVDCWKWLLAILLMTGIAIVVILKTK